jgi:Ca2+-transporting ATPase
LSITSGLDTKYYEYAKNDVNSVLKELKSSHNGLTDAEVKLCTKQYGYNDPVKRDRKPAIIQFLLKFTNPLIIVLLVIAIFTLFYAE